MCFEGEGKSLNFFVDIFSTERVLLRYFRLCYRLVKFLSMRISHFLSWFFFKHNLIHIGRSGFFDILDFFQT